MLCILKAWERLEYEAIRARTLQAGGYVNRFLRILEVVTPADFKTVTLSEVDGV